jgi:putative transcriptional regulator
MEDPRFKDAVVYVCEHNDNGAIGVMINQASDITISDLFERIELELPSMARSSEPHDNASEHDGAQHAAPRTKQSLDGNADNLTKADNAVDDPAAPHPLTMTPVLHGGPVQHERGFVLHEPQRAYHATIAIGGKTGDRALTTSRDVLEAVSKGKGPDNMLVTLGYSGWSAGQLEDEIANNAWLTIPAGNGAGDILWNTPLALRKNAAIRLLGIDPVVLTGFAGHA